MQNTPFYIPIRTFSQDEKVYLIIPQHKFDIIIRKFSIRNSR